ncbi:hypothetical protein ACGFX4_37170 [Kitasatospora sp. NPDC048365]|uniref:hypothetical protein n=1 Tax=Kitasatospora sp. NPDC048365 TaxID=3364050 RepID=UPI003719F0DF
MVVDALGVGSGVVEEFPAFGGEATARVDMHRKIRTRYGLTGIGPLAAFSDSVIYPGPPGWRARRRPAHLRWRPGPGCVPPRRPATGTTAPDGRLRQLTKTLPADYAARLFDAQLAGDEEAAKAVLAECIQNDYFKEGGRADALEVQIDEIDHIEFDW